MKKIFKLSVLAVLVLVSLAIPSLADTTIVGGIAAVTGNHALAAAGGFGNDIALESVAYVETPGTALATGDAYVTGDFAASGAGSTAETGEYYNSAEAVSYVRGMGDTFGYTISNAWGE